MAHICFVAGTHDLYDYRIFYKACRAFVDAGHAVSYVVEAPEACVLEGVHIVPARRPRGKVFSAARLLGLLPTLMKLKADAYHMCSVKLLPVGIALKLLTGKTVTYDGREDYAAHMLMKTYLPLPIRYLAHWSVVILENLAAGLFDGFVMADPGTMADHTRMPACRKIVFYNTPLLSFFPENPVPWARRKYDVVLLGSMSLTSGTLVLLDALARLTAGGRRLRALFIGKPTLTDFDRHVRDRGLSDVVELTGHVHHKKVPELLNECKIGLIGLLDLPKFHKNIAMKMFEYWAKGLPVVAPDLPPERRFLTDGEHGYLVAPGEADAFAEAIARLLDDPRRSEAMAKAVREHIIGNGYYAEIEQEKLVTFYNALLRNPR